MVDDGSVGRSALLEKLEADLDDDDQRQVRLKLESLRSMTMAEMCRDLTDGRVSSKHKALKAWEAEQRAKRKADRRSRSGTPSVKADAATPRMDDTNPTAETGSDQPSQLQNGSKSTPGDSGEGSSQLSGRKRKADNLDVLAEAIDIAGKSAASPSDSKAPNTSGAIQVRFRPDGSLEVDQQSTQVDRALRDYDPSMEANVVEETQFDRRINAASFGRHERTERWRPDEEERFYKYLGQWGTDFEIMSKLFQGRSRAQLKRKFVLEEKRNPSKVKAALYAPSGIDKNEYDVLSGHYPSEQPPVSNGT